MCINKYIYIYIQQKQENFANRQTSHFGTKSPYIWVTAVPSVILFSFFFSRLNAQYKYKHSSRNITTMTFNGYIIIGKKMNVHINKPNYYSALIQNIMMWYAWLVSNRLLSILIDLLFIFSQLFTFRCRVPGVTGAMCVDQYGLTLAGVMIFFIDFFSSFVICSDHADKA